LVGPNVTDRSDRTCLRQNTRTPSRTFAAPRRHRPSPAGEYVTKDFVGKCKEATSSPGPVAWASMRFSIAVDVYAIALIRLNADHPNEPIND
jgi:hypothetical protein